jgi:simple sugar transport system ATP-binding protein
VPELGLDENLVMSDWSKVSRTGVISRSRLSKAAHSAMDAMSVKTASATAAIGTLSGGNLQKFVVGREILAEPGVLVINQPTWGVDAGAASRIRQALVDLARAGSAVVVISQDLDEIFEVATDIAVICEGRLSRPFPAGELTRERIGLLMGGLHESSSAPEAPHAH